VALKPNQHIALTTHKELKGLLRAVNKGRNLIMTADESKVLHDLFLKNFFKKL